MPDKLECRDIINQSLYPIDEPEDARRAVTVEKVRADDLLD